MLKFTDFFDGKIEEPVEVDPHTGETLDERVLNVQDRMKLSRRMKRFQHRIQRKRKIQARRKADMGRLGRRARKGARDDMKKMIDQKLENKAKQSAIKRFTKRKVKDKRKLDIARRR